jgi:AraC-like DNA-binding protein
MSDYMSAREAAAVWGISERRVQKLCEDGKIAGVVRFGHSWSIPSGTSKPADGRMKKSVRVAGERSSEPRMAGDFWGPDAKILSRHENCTICQLENDTGNGIITMYDVFPGIRLFYNDLHLSEITGHGILIADGAENIIEVNHCREGRFECEFQDGECAYIGDGDLSVNVTSACLKSPRFPLTHYHGISIDVDIPLAAKTIEKVSEALGAVKIDLYAIKERLCSPQPVFIMRGTDSIQHIFSELYNTPDGVKESYIKLKVMELMLFLGSVDLAESRKSRRYFYRTRVDTVKAMRDYMAAHMDSQFTLEELSERFSIPLTSMKNCFKSVFGAPIHSYMREYRLQTAAAMLRETDASIADIAAKIGYDSHAKFSAAFKSALGTNPSEYRKVSVQKGLSVSE